MTRAAEGMRTRGTSSFRTTWIQSSLAVLRRSTRDYKTSTRSQAWSIVLPRPPPSPRTVICGPRFVRSISLGFLTILPTQLLLQIAK